VPWAVQLNENVSVPVADAVTVLLPSFAVAVNVPFSLTLQGDAELMPTDDHEIVIVPFTETVFGCAMICATAVPVCPVDAV
jgi:hypothetical protein